MGIKWRHQGRTRNGIDCAGLVLVVSNDLGIVDYENSNYQRRTHGTDFLAPFKLNMDQKPPNDMAPGDVMLFRDGKYPCHSAIIGDRGGDLTIIHAHAPHRRVIEERIEQGDWMIKRVACFQFRGITD